jgi:3'(2'), 5'-bisphosphate nucleotidase
VAKGEFDSMDRIAAELAAIAVRAGAVVMQHYRQEAAARLKDDRTPVTDADEAAETLILDELGRAFPGVPVAAEEEMAAGKGFEPCAHFFLVDPLDGTREFLKRNGEFTVNIAEVKNGTAVAGAVYAPAKARLFFADAAGAFEVDGAPDAIDLSAARPIHVRAPAKDGLIVTESRSHRDAATEEFLRRFEVKEILFSGSSLKFCLVAAGEADLYARGGRTMEWDTAAGHAVLSAAGGSVTGWDGTPFVYGKPGFANGPFVARGL